MPTDYNDEVIVTSAKEIVVAWVKKQKASVKKKEVIDLLDKVLDTFNKEFLIKNRNADGFLASLRAKKKK